MVLFVFIPLLLFMPFSAGRASDVYPDLPHRNREATVIKTGIEVDHSLVDETQWPVVATNIYNGEMLVVYQMDFDIYGQRLDSEGEKIGTRFRISSGQGRANSPEVAYEAGVGRFVVVWEYDNSVNMTIDWKLTKVFGVHQSTGSQMDGGYYTDGSPSYDDEEPTIACNKDTSSCLVVISRTIVGELRLVGQRYQIQNGIELSRDGDPFEITNDSYKNRAPAVAFGDVSGTGVYLVAWERVYFPLTTNYIVFIHVYGVEQGNGSDETMHTEVYLTPPGGTPVNDHNSQQPACAFNPLLDQFLVVYQYDFYGDSSDVDIMGRHVSGLAGAVVGTIFSIAATSQQEWFPDVAFSGGETPWLSIAFADQYLVTFIYENYLGYSSVRVQAVDGGQELLVGEVDEVLTLTPPWVTLKTSVCGSYHDGRWIVVADHGYDDGITSNTDISAALVVPYASWLPLLIK
jgi:hypothetical protein